jgi:hypothetical protein
MKNGRVLVRIKSKPKRSDKAQDCLSCGGSVRKQHLREAMGLRVNKRTGILQRDSAGFSRVRLWQLVFELFQATIYPCKLGLQGFDRPEFPE